MNMMQLFHNVIGHNFIIKQEKLIESETEKVQPISKPITPLHVNIITQDKSSNS